MPTNSSNLHSVDILLSTYNGIAYLEPQIESLLKQSHKSWRLLIRDDGSTDGTIEIVERYVAAYPEKIIIVKDTEGSLGPTLSFSRLLERSSAEYSLFCDQDDVWEPDKIAVTLDSMRSIEAESGSVPVLVHTDMKVVDSSLGVLSDSFWKYQNLNPGLAALRNLLILNNVTGCTVMVNGPLRKLATPIPPEAILHDWWVALVAAAFGHTGYVKSPTMLYRQHASNVAGSTSYSINYFLSRLGSLGSTARLLERIVAQAVAFESTYKSMFKPTDLKTVTAFVSLLRSSRFTRLKLLFKFGFKGMGFLRNLGIYLLLFFMPRSSVNRRAEVGKGGPVMLNKDNQAMGFGPGAKAPLLSIIIVNWNGERFLGQNLESIFAQSFKDFEVLFVDNGSTDGSVRFVRLNYPEVRLVENKENLGFARANNQGIEKSRGRFVLTLNNDTILEDSFLEILMGVATASSGTGGQRAGMWAPKILSMQDPGVIDSVGGLLLYPNGIGRGQGRNEVDNAQYDSNKSALIPSACAGLYRREMLEEVGLFDPDFFAYCEDTDLGLRGRLAGWGCVSVPAATLKHYYSGTSGSHTPFKAYLVERNHLWVALKLFPLRNLLLFPFYEVWRYLAQVRAVRSGQGAGARLAGEVSMSGLIGIVVKAYIGAFAHLPSLIAKRRALKKRSNISTREFRELLKLYSISAKELVLKD